MAKEIVWTESSIIDRFVIYQFWLQHNQSPTYSEKLEKIFQESSVLISNFPESGTTTDLVGIRVKVIGKHYKIFYRILTEQIEIVRVWDARQDPDHFKTS